MCDQQPSLIPYLSFEEERRRLLYLSRYCGRKRYKKVGRVGRRTMLYLVLCNGKWLRVV
jgi:hypothetical protein